MKLTRAAAVAALSVVAVSFASPALADTVTPSAPAGAGTSVNAPATVKVPPFPGLNASPAELQAWSEQLSKAYNLPPMPDENASEAEFQAYADQVAKAMGIPAIPDENVSDAEFLAWFQSYAKALGLPKPPTTPDETAWMNWFQRAFGIDLSQLDSMSDAELEALFNQLATGDLSGLSKLGVNVPAAQVPGKGTIPSLPKGPKVPSMPGTSKPTPATTGPKIQTDYVAPQQSNTAATGAALAAAGVLAGAAFVVRRRSARR